MTIADTDLTEDLPKSKTQIKREMDGLQKLGERLTQLSSGQLAQVPMDDKLSAAIHEHGRLRKHEAKRRQLQYIGRLMRDADAEAIAQVVERFSNTHRAQTQSLHKVEGWRDRLIEDTGALTEFIDAYPNADSQQFRQLIRQAKKEQERGRNLGAYRKLFQLLRSTLETKDS